MLFIIIITKSIVNFLLNFLKKVKKMFLIEGIYIVQLLFLKPVFLLLKLKTINSATFLRI